MLGWSRDHLPGGKPLLSDAEFICLAVAQQLLGIASDRRWIRYARARLAGLFPYLPGPSGYGKRMRRQGGLLAAVITELARGSESWHDLLRLVDSTPLPCAASRQTVQRSDLAGHAGYGYCASHSRFFWGYRLYLVTTAEGMPVIWGLAHPGLGEREVVAALLTRDHRLVRAGQVILGDKGFAGHHFEAFITDGLGAHLIRPDRKDDPPGSASWPAAGSGSKPSSTPSRASSPWKPTAGAPWPGSTPAPPPGCSPSPPRSGTTGASAHPSNDP
jgi:hypothetical protein